MPMQPLAHLPISIVELTKCKFSISEVEATEVAAEIPGFKPSQRKINRENNKVVCGPKKCFYDFLSPTIEEIDQENDE